MSIPGYLNYGVDIILARKIDRAGISPTTFRNTSKRNLIDKYHLSIREVDIVKKCLTRSSIPENILNDLLDNSLRVCCVCHGVKSNSYIIHHLDQYSMTQDHSYDNLAVLCPACHDEAHKTTGVTLTRTLSSREIAKCKESWEEQVRGHMMWQPPKAGNLMSIDFINIPRLCEMMSLLKLSMPTTANLRQLIKHNMADSDGRLNNLWMDENIKSGSYPFDSFSANYILDYFSEVFDEIFKSVEFQNVDSLLNKKSLKSDSVIGKLCFYSGGVYGKTVNFPITRKSEPTLVYFRRRLYKVNWLLDVKYLTSMTAISRIGERSRLLIYGVVTNVYEKIIDNKRISCIDIRPLIAGVPYIITPRKPAIHWRDQQGYED